jgi:hypothetical protein
MLDFAMKRKYIAENPAAEVKHFNELRERPTRRMLTLDEEKRIFGCSAGPSSRADHSPLPNWRKKI